jgi:hypothetical protein
MSETKFHTHTEGLHGAIFQKTELFLATAVEASYPVQTLQQDAIHLAHRVGLCVSDNSRHKQ